MDYNCRASISFLISMSRFIISIGVRLFISVEASLSIYYLQLTIYYLDKRELLSNSLVYCWR